ncbi:MAG TPA: hypothetical protein VK988_13785 [Acidimicrobiales bacterium]|nr:hypothetical protein [Acidimicrobiales bacterium]
MSALWAALGCSLMMLVVLGGFALYALSGRKSSDEASEVTDLRAEIAELRQRQSDERGDELTGRR